MDIDEIDYILIKHNLHEKVWDIMISKIPAGRAGTPEDVGNMVAFLSSDEASYINGQIIEVSGGMIL